MNKSESITNLAKSLSRAQAEFEAIGFDSTNPFLKNGYASLGAIIEKSKAVLAKHGLSVSQPTITNEFGVGVTTILLHDSGEYLESTVTIPIGEEKGKSMAQVAGSVITYLRRYSLASILNLYSEEDTDGEGKKTEQKAPAPKAKQLMTIEQAKAMTGGMDNKKYGDCTQEELEGKQIGIVKALNDKTISQDKKDAYILKLEAVKILLANRSS